MLEALDIDLHTWCNLISKYSWRTKLLFQFNRLGHGSSGSSDWPNEPEKARPWQDSNPKNSKSGSSIKKIIYFYVSRFLSASCMSTPGLCIWSNRWLWAAVSDWELNPGLQEEQQVPLTTEPPSSNLGLPIVSLLGTPAGQCQPMELASCIWSIIIHLVKISLQRESCSPLSAHADCSPLECKTLGSVLSTEKQTNKQKEQKQQPYKEGHRASPGLKVTAIWEQLSPPPSRFLSTSNWFIFLLSLVAA